MTTTARTLLILGLGESGLAMARWCARQGDGTGASLTVWDSREAPPHAAALASELPAARLIGGPLDPALLDEASLVLKSPGLSPLDDRLQPLLARARALAIPVQGELALFVQALARLKAERGYAPKLIAITGTNGKTTTTAMTALLAERAGRHVAVAGNIGPTLLQTLSEALDRAPLPATAVADAEALAHAAPPPEPTADAQADAPSEANAALPEVWVLELSSFQLDGVEGFCPDAAAVLNLTEDHLDWHGSMAAYAEAKGRIFANPPTLRVVNRDDPLVEALVAPPPPAVVKGKPQKLAARPVLRFGLGAPSQPGDYGIVTEHGMAWLVRAMEADETLKRGRKADAEAEELHIQRLMPADALRVRGRHNAANALAALALAGAIGCPLAPMLHGLREYRGEPHRVQHVATLDGVEAYDDSKGTNVGATVAAITGLGADRHPARLVLILGGDGKGQDFAPLREPLLRHARAVATLGRDAAAIEAMLADSGLPVQRHDSLPSATRWCFQQARPGDAVLLSPACASLDMFHNYAHRAQVFVDEVRALGQELGELSA